MNKRDKDKLLILVFLLLYCGMTYLFIKGTANIPWQVLIIIMLVGEYLILQPRVCELYYSACNQKAGISRFLPIWNEIMMFKSNDAMFTLVSYVLLAISVGMFFVPIETVATVFGEKIMFNYGVYCIRFMAVMIIVNSVAVGKGFISVIMKLKRMHFELTDGGSLHLLNPLIMLLVFLPVVRTFSLVAILNVLIKLVQLNGYHTGTKINKDLVEEIE